MKFKKLITVSALVFVSACVVQQPPAPYVDKGDRIYGRADGEFGAEERARDDFKEVPNPSLDSSNDILPAPGSTVEFIDSNEPGRARIKTAKVIPPEENAEEIIFPEKKELEIKVPVKPTPVEEKAPAKKVEEKPVNQMVALDDIKPKSKPKLKSKEKELAKEEMEREEKPSKPEQKAAQKKEEEKSSAEEVIKSDKAEAKEEKEEVIKLPAKPDEAKKKKSEEKPTPEKIAAEKSKEEPKKKEIKEEKSEPEKPVAKASSSGKFIKPLEGTIIKKFGEKNGATTNDGINIQAPDGTPVQAADNGSVVYSGNQLQGYGNLIIIRHSSGYLTAYAHMKDLLIKKGADVKQGDVIGHVGKTGNVDQPQLHFGVRKGRDPVDPEPFL